MQTFNSYTASSGRQCLYRISHFIPLSICFNPPLILHNSRPNFGHCYYSHLTLSSFICTCLLRCSAFAFALYICSCCLRCSALAARAALLLLLALLCCCFFYCLAVPHFTLYCSLLSTASSHSALAYCVLHLLLINSHSAYLTSSLLFQLSIDSTPCSGPSASVLAPLSALLQVSLPVKAKLSTLVSSLRFLPNLRTEAESLELPASGPGNECSRYCGCEPQAILFS